MTKVLVAWSGGKDSQASLIWACKKYGAKNVDAIFCDTGWENPITYLHVVDICEQMGVPLTILRSSKYDGFEDLANKKKRFPSTKARFCTEELKTKPMIDHILSLRDHLIIVQGIRADESNARALMAKQCRYFKYYFTPYTDNISKVKTLEKAMRKNKTDKQVKKLEKLKERLRNGKLDEKYHTYRKKEVFEWCSRFSDDVHRPYFDKQASEVMNDIFAAGQKPNKLYYMGRARVGCDPCIMCRHSEVKAMVKFTPESVERLRNAEKRLGRAFFPPKYIPNRYCTGRDRNGKVFPVVDDVINYLTGGEYAPELFAEHEKEEHRCMSFYGICE